MKAIRVATLAALALSAPLVLSGCIMNPVGGDPAPTEPSATQPNDRRDRADGGSTEPSAAPGTTAPQTQAPAPSATATQSAPAMTEATSAAPIETGSQGEIGSWPSDVPFPDGKVVEVSADIAQAMASIGTDAVVAVEGGEAELQRYFEQLRAAGFSEQPGVITGMSSYVKGKHAVTGIAVEEHGGWSIVIAVGPAQ